MTTKISLVANTWKDTGVSTDCTVSRKGLGMIFAERSAITPPNTMHGIYLQPNTISLYGTEKLWLYSNQDTIVEISTDLLLFPRASGGTGPGTSDHNLLSNKNLLLQHVASTIAIDRTNFVNIIGNNLQEMLEDIDKKILQTSHLTALLIAIDTSGAANVTGSNVDAVIKAIDSIITALKQRDISLQTEIDNIKGAVSSVAGKGYISPNPESDTITINHGLNTDHLIVTTASQHSDGTWQQNLLPWKQDINDPKNTMVFYANQNTNLYNITLASINVNTSYATTGMLQQVQVQVTTNTNTGIDHEVSITQNAQTIATQGNQLATQDAQIQHNSGNILKNAHHIGAMNKQTPVYPVGTELLKNVNDDFINNTKDKYKIVGESEVENLVDGNPNHYVTHSYVIPKDLTVNRTFGPTTLIAFLDSNNHIGICVETNISGWKVYFNYFPDGKYYGGATEDQTDLPIQIRDLDMSRINDDTYIQLILNNMCKIFFDHYSTFDRAFDQLQHPYRLTLDPPSSIVTAATQPTAYTIERISILPPS